MINKKDIPFDLRMTVEEIAIKQLDLIKIQKDENTYYSFTEIDKDPRYFFRIFIDGTKRIGNFNKTATNFAFEFKPTSSLSLTSSLSQGGLEQIKSLLQTWVELVRKISETPSIHDDNFEIYYADYYFHEFKIVDEDADYIPFTPVQQDSVEIYLLSLKKAIENNNQTISIDDKREIIEEIENVITTLETSTKTKVMKGVTKVFGKLFKKSKEFAKEVIKEAKKELIKKLIDLGIEYGPKLLEAFTNKPD